VDNIRRANTCSVGSDHDINERRPLVQSNPEHPAAGKAVVYVRLSGQPYGYDPFSPDNQLRICRDHARNHRVEIVAEYQDLAVSGRRGEIERPGFEACLELLRRQVVEILYVATLDRFSRRGLHHVTALLEEVDAAGGRVIVAVDGLDTRLAADRQTISSLAELARAEADAASWRLSEWHAHNRRNGLWKRIRPFGYTVANGKLEPHPTEAPIVRAMVDSFLAGSSLRGIAKWLNAEGVKPPRLVFYEEALAKGYNPRTPPAKSWSYVAVRGVLAAPALAALMSHAGELCRDERGHLIVAGVGIVTQDERAQILAGLQRRASPGGPHQGGRREGGKNPQPKYLLTGLGRCGECGKALQRIVTRRGGVYYRCAAKGRGQTCRGGLISGAFLESEVVRHLLEGRDRSVRLPPAVLEELRDGWEDLPLAWRRAVLTEVIRQVWVYAADIPVDRRVHIVWAGENPPRPRGARPVGSST
jgi:DNA invertase Pin-like site-specific DNA recombinase